MKRIAPLYILGSVMLYAQEKSEGTEMTGTICDFKCVTQSSGLAASDPQCTKTGGDAVFVEDNGKVTKIANSDKVAGVHGEARQNQEQDDEGPRRGPHVDLRDIRLNERTFAN